MKVKKGYYNFDGEEWAPISEDAKDVIKACLKINPADRPTAEKILEFNWFKKDLSKEKPLTSSTQSFLNNYSK